MHLILHCSDLPCAWLPTVRTSTAKKVWRDAVERDRRPEAVALSADGFEVEYITEDGAGHRVPLADAWAVQFEAMAPARGFRARKVSDICRAAGGRRRMVATSAMSRGWNAIM